MDYMTGLRQAVVKLGEGVHALDQRCFLNFGSLLPGITSTIFAVI